MAIIRIQKRVRPYVQIDKTALEDERLSFKAKGLLCYLLSRPDNWNVRVDHLATVSNDGATAVKSALRELRKAGYCKLRRKMMTDESGASRLSGSEYLVYETPESKETRLSGNPTVRKPDHRETYLHNKNEHTNNDLTNNDKVRPIDFLKDSAEQIDSSVMALTARERARFFVYVWNQLYSASARYTQEKEKHVTRVLRHYKPSEVIRALQNRKKSRWLWDEGIMAQWNKFWAHGDKVDDYLNYREPKKNEPEPAYNMPINWGDK